MPFSTAEKPITLWSMPFSTAEKPNHTLEYAIFYGGKTQSHF
jgi:hypothetical protein